MRLQLATLVAVVAALAVVSEANNSFPDCYATQTQNSGEFQYPTDPNAKEYPNNARACVRLIPEALGGGGGRCKFAFNKLDVEKDYDFVQVYDWTVKRWVTKEAGPRDTFSTTEGLFVYFTSDHSVQKKGFTIKWSCETSEGRTDSNTDAEDDEEKKVSVDLHLAENHRNSKTTRFESDGSLIIRRGTDFKITVANGAMQSLLLSAQISDSRNERIQLAPDGKFKKGWAVTKGSGKGEFIVKTQPDAALAVYDLDVVLEGGAIVADDATVYLLCNAYNPEDVCGKCTAKQREDMLEDDEGYAFFGSSNRWGKMKWGFDQYVMQNVKVTFGALKGLSFEHRRDVAKVTRYLSWVGNNKILHGRWDGEYGDGKEPGHWTDTTEIFRVYTETGERVKYGQCWVFASMTVTLHRALGICSRSLTNFDSAHEHPHHGVFDGIIENYYEERDDGMIYRQNELTKDSTWNFHVWNEIIISRPDIDGGSPMLKDGAQAVDTTCQEMSDGRCQCGPAPIAAMYRGFDWMDKNPLYTKSYDTRFVASETDAMEKGYLKKRGESKHKKWRIDTRKIGQLSLTWMGKVVDRSKAYKQEHYRGLVYAQGDQWPDLENFRVSGTRSVFLEMLRNSTESRHVDARLVYNKKALEKADIGDDFVFSLQVTKKADNRPVKGFIMVEAISYIGNVVLGVVKKEECQLTGSRGTTDRSACTIKIAEKDYAKFCSKTLHFRVTGVVNGGTEESMWQDSVNIMLGTPEIRWRNARVGDKTMFTVEQGSETKFRMRFRNGFKNTPLTGCHLSAYVTGHMDGKAMDAALMEKGLEQDQVDLTTSGSPPDNQDKPPTSGSTTASTVPPTAAQLAERVVDYSVGAGKEVTMTIAVKGSVLGKHSVMATVQCNELVTVHGEHQLEVTKRSTPVKAGLSKASVENDLKEQKAKLQKLKQENQGKLPPPEPAQMEVEPPVMSPQEQAEKKGQDMAIKVQQEMPGEKVQPQDQAPKDQAPKDQVPKDQAPKDQAPKDQAPKDQAPQEPQKPQKPQAPQKPQRNTVIKTVDRTKEILSEIQEDLSDLNTNRVKKNIQK